VFTLSGDNASLVGILWGGSSDGKTMVYSPMSNVEMSSELGSLTTFGSGGSTNNPPTASFTYSCTSLTCNFNASASDSDGSVVSYAWNFGDSSSGSGATASHSYTSGGTFTVTLTVTDNDGATGSVSHNVTVSSPSTGTTVHVNAITYATSGGKTGDKNLSITLSLIDDKGALVSGASVSIQLYLGSLPLSSGAAQTGTNGTVTFTLHNAPSGTYHTEVTNVTAAGLTWDGTTPANSFTK
jgi:hypothetical protein